MIYFTSDTHYGHTNIIKYCDRPFPDRDIMDKVLIENWNNTVRDDDVVYHLGDISFRKENETMEILAQLNGKKHLIWGNHDKHYRKSSGVTGFFRSTNEYLEITLEGERFVLMHFPIQSWNGASHGAIHLHGHSHNKLPTHGIENRFDVGVDATGYTPISIVDIFSKVVQKMFK